MRRAIISSLAVFLGAGVLWAQGLQRVEMEIAWPGDGLLAVDVLYGAEQAELSGLGLRLHYNSEELEFVGYEGLLEQGLVGAMEPAEDVKNFDGDSTTDAYILVAWADIDGFWPGVNQAGLYRALFRPLKAAESVPLRFSASSTAAGHELRAESVQLDLKPDRRALQKLQQDRQN